MTKNTCHKCGSEFDKWQEVDGKNRNFRNRKCCLNCVPLHGHCDKVEKTCKKCGNKFYNEMFIDGNKHYFGNRKFCLTCSPFKGNNRQNLAEPIDYISPRTCQRCNEQYTYDRTKGHRKSFCNSCKTICRDIEKKCKAVEYKGGSCVVCGYNRCMRSLSFHHIDPKQKYAGIGQMYNLSWDKIKAELDKCILLCNNCHGEFHDGLIQLENHNHVKIQSS